MKKGQGNSKRKTIEEAYYGVRITGEALNHIRLCREFDSLTALVKNPFPEEDLKKMRRWIEELKPEIFASWEIIRSQPGALRTLADVAERAQKPAAYPDEFAMLAFYEQERAMGKTVSHEQLKAHVENFAPTMTDGTFSKKKKQYGLSNALPKSKPGPKPERAKRQ